MKCALIGFGYWGKILQKYILKSNVFSLKYIYSPSLNNGIGIEEIFNDKEIECLFICTPINTHYELVKRALENGKHVFCEKPLTKKSDELLELTNISKEKNLCLHTNYIYTQSKSINYIKSKLNEIGKIKYIKAKIQQFGKFYKSDNVYEVIAVHMISAIIYILGEKNIKFDVIRAFSIKKYKENILDAVINFKINEKIKGIIECSLISKEKSRTIELVGENGSIYFDMLSNNTVSEILLEEENDNYGMKIQYENHMQYDESNNLELALNYFYDSICDLRKDNLNLSLKVTQILENINLITK